MANEISSMVVAQASAAVSKSGQFTKLDAVNVPQANQQNLPQEGKELPQQSANTGKSVSSSDLKQAVSQINDYVQSVRRDLSFSMDEASGKTVIRVMDSESGKLVRQIPSEEVLALANYLQGVREDSMGNEGIPPGFLFSDST